MEWDDLARRIGYNNEFEMMNHLYTDEGLSIHEISLRLGCATFTVKRHLDACKIVMRGRGGNNNKARQTLKLFRLDQRAILLHPLDKLAELSGTSRSLCYKYRIRQTGGLQYEILHHLPDRGSYEVLDLKQHTLTPTSDSDEKLQRLLQLAEEGGGLPDPR